VIVIADRFRIHAPSWVPRQPIVTEA